MGEFWLILYVVAWAITFLIVRKHHESFGVSSFVVLLYLVIAICSFLLYKNPYYIGVWKPLKFFPFLYLYLMLLVAIMPLLRYKESDGLMLLHPNTRVLKTFTYVIIITSFLQIPSVLMNLSDGLQLIFLNIDNAAEIYADRKIEIASSTKGGINVSFLNSFSIIANIFSDFCIFLFFYYKTIREKDRFINVSLIIIMVVSILRPLSQANRTEGILTLLTVIATYLLFKPYIEDSVKKSLRKYIAVIMAIILVPVVIITISRFSSSSNGALYSVEEYIGQCNLYFNNYALDDNGTREGERTCNIFKQIVGFKNVSTDVRSCRDKYPQLYLDDTNFSTFVGDFTIDFGPHIPVFLFIIFSLIFCKCTRAPNGSIEFHQLVVLYFVLIVCTKGAMYLFPFSFTDNYKILAFLFTYYLFRNTKHVIL